MAQMSSQQRGSAPSSPEKTQAGPPWCPQIYVTSQQVFSGFVDSSELLLLRCVALSCVRLVSVMRKAAEQKLLKP